MPVRRWVKAGPGRSPGRLRDRGPGKEQKPGRLRDRGSGEGLGRLLGATCDEDGAGCVLQNVSRDASDQHASYHSFASAAKY